MGEPSSHTASGFSWYVTVNGSSVSPPFSNDGASARRGDATKLPSGSSCIARGRTCSRTVYHVQSLAPQYVMGLRQFGHPSAPNTLLPPCLDWKVDVGV